MFWAWAANPPMGWNSWDCFATTVTEEQAKAQADYMAEHLARYGWQYLVVDIQWYEPEAKSFEYRKGARLNMDEFGRLWPATNRFPSSRNGVGFAALSEYVHRKGLKFGVHLLRGIPRQAVALNTPIKGTSHLAAQIADTNSTCAWNTDMFGVDMTRAGAQDYYNSVFELFAAWGVDFVKVDDIARPYHQSEIEGIRRAIDHAGRPMVLSLSPGETPLAKGDHVSTHANMWRVSDDFWDKWSLLLEQFDRLQKWTPYRGPGHFPDADMLPLGVTGMGRRTHFTKDEQYTLMSLWAMARSPLIFGGDLTRMDAFTLSLLTNREVIALDQNSTGNREIFNQDGLIGWAAEVPGSADKYVALFNTRDARTNETGVRVPVRFAELGLGHNCRVRDLWKQKDLGPSENEFAPEINWHGTGLYRISGTNSKPEFNDPKRKQKIESVLPGLDSLFDHFAKTEHIPGLVYGVLLDGKLFHSRAFGFANLQQKIPAAPDTVFRIASMTKSFVSLAVFKLRDDGKLSLDDPVEKYLSEFPKVQPPTSDSPRVTVRNLMTMTTGLPEDNPWGDRQLAISQEALKKFVSGGLSFSNPTGQQYEYSNLGFVLLGQVVSSASGIPFQKYITTNILGPLGMTNTHWEFAEIAADKLALGYRWEHGVWALEPMLHDGEGAACGGLITTLDDFAKYVQFHLDAWPARDDPDFGPVRRATVREMQKPFVFSRMAPKGTLLDGVTPNPSISFYGYGLGWSIDSRQIVTLAHSGGLPGFGSHYRFLPDYGVGVIAFANRTYAPAGPPCNKAIDILLEHGGIQPRAIVVSSILETRARQLGELLGSWDSGLCDNILAENFFLDKSREDWVKASKEALAKAGKIKSVGPVNPENQLRGTFAMRGARGRVDVHFTLTPEKIPKVQELDLNFVPKSRFPR